MKNHPSEKVRTFKTKFENIKNERNVRSKEETQKLIRKLNESVFSLRTRIRSDYRSPAFVEEIEDLNDLADKIKKFKDKFL